MRWIAGAFLGLTVLAGLTLGSPVLALVNAIVFAVLALAAIRFAGPRWGDNGRVWAMAGAFFLSLLLPFILLDSQGEGQSAPVQVTFPGEAR